MKSPAILEHRCGRRAAAAIRPLAHKAAFYRTSRGSRRGRACDRNLPIASVTTEAGLFDYNRFDNR